MWYHMKRKTLEREYDEFQERLQQLKKKSEQSAREHLILFLRLTQRYQQEIAAIDQQFRLLSSGVRRIRFRFRFSDRFESIS